MELTRKDIKMTQGLAILTMVSLHLFCRLGTDVYGTPLLWLNSTTPAVYILGWLSEICIPLYSICSGYAHYKLGESGGLSKKRICNRIIKFLIKLLDCLYSVCSYRSCCGNGSEGTRFLERIFWKHVLY